MDKRLQTFNKQTRARYEGMLSLMTNTKNKVVLDIGSGVNALSTFIQTNKTITLDLDTKHNATIVCNLNEGKIPLADNSVDMIIAGEIIEHLTDPNAIIAECHRILKKGGEVIISTPNICSLVNRAKMLIGQLPAYSCYPVKGKNHTRHFTDYNVKTVNNMFYKEGFKLEKMINNGIVLHAKIVFPITLTPTTLAENIIAKYIKI